MTETDQLALLKQTKVFEGLSEEQLKRIAGQGRRRKFGADTAIIREGQKDHSLFIIIYGTMEVVLSKKAAVGSSGRPTRIKLGRLQQGDCVGEYSLIDGLPASADVMAVEPCEMFEIPRNCFQKIIDTDDAAAKTIFENLLKLMIARARERNKELDLCY